jgi:hypothetical protein
MGSGPSKNRVDTPSWMRRRLRALDGVSLVRRDGAWDTYSVAASANRTRVSVAHLLMSAGTPNPDARLAASPDRETTFAAGIIPSIPQDAALLPARGLTAVPQSATRAFEAAAPAPKGSQIVGSAAVAEGDNVMSARYFPGAKAVIVSAGRSDGYTIVNHSGYPFKLPTSDGRWFARNGTMLHIRTGDVPLEVDALFAGKEPITDVVGIAWRDGWRGFGTRPFSFPVVLPANREIIVQINHRVRSRAIDVITPLRTYHVSMRGIPTPHTMRVRRSAAQRAFLLYAPCAGMFAVTLTMNDRVVHGAGLEIGHSSWIPGHPSGESVSFRNVILQGGVQRVTVRGLPPNLRVRRVLALSGRRYLMPSGSSAVKYTDISPVMTTVKLPELRKAVLVFSENYNPQWQLLDGRPSIACLIFGCKPLGNHMLVDGYANGWYIDALPAGTVTIFFKPQVLEWLGWLVCAIWVVAVSATCARVRLRRTRTEGRPLDAVAIGSK